MGVHVDVSDEAITVTFSGWDQIWALCHQRTIALSDITGARVAAVDELRAELGWRVGGTYWPGAVAAGWYSVRGRKGARQLWSVYRDPEVLVIDTTLERPCRLVLQLADRHDVAWFIGERLTPRH